jgi:hypothetical protein
MAENSLLEPTFIQDITMFLCDGVGNICGQILGLSIKGLS